MTTQGKPGHTGDLVYRLEKATGGSRELDAAIHVSDYDPTADIKPPHTDVASCLGCDCAPRYTASIDAALTLVPEGWMATIITNDPTFSYQPSQLAHAELKPFNTNDNGWKVYAHCFGRSHAATPALALCIAALKARAALSAAKGDAR